MVLVSLNGALPLLKPSNDAYMHLCGITACMGESCKVSCILAIPTGCACMNLNCHVLRAVGIACWSCLSHIHARKATCPVLPDIELQLVGAESIHVDTSGMLHTLDKYGNYFTSMPDGDGNYSALSQVAFLGPSRPLGFGFDSSDNLVVCDARIVSRDVGPV